MGDSNACGGAPDGPAQQLNRYCHCMAVDRDRLAAALGLGDSAAALTGLLASHPYLFSDSALFVEQAQLRCMRRLIAAVERVVAMPAWQQRVLGDAHPHARVPSATAGLLLGYDFHLGPDGPRLIEINTNAGGALLHAALQQAQTACCDAVLPPQGQPAEQALAGMFLAEWQRARGAGAPALLAIVDDDPAGQFLYPEFARYAQLLRERGIDTVIADARELRVAGDALCLPDGRRVDFVYNRCTDFLLVEPGHAALAQAWREGLAVVTPGPRHWALYAAKPNLAILSDAGALAALGVAEDDIRTLVHFIPRTVLLHAGNADTLWQERNRWFFKPAAGYGSKAAYRGDKLTRGKWQEILASGDYVAQQLVPPGERMLQVDGQERPLKADVRNYVYDGEVLLCGARLYQGQTTNLRTPGGGLATVFATGDQNV
jgi:hypothetical protein